MPDISLLLALTGSVISKCAFDDKSIPGDLLGGIFGEIAGARSDESLKDIEKRIAANLTRHQPHENEHIQMAMQRAFWEATLQVVAIWGEEIGIPFSAAHGFSLPKAIKSWVCTKEGGKRGFRAYKYEASVNTLYTELSQRAASPIDHEYRLPEELRGSKKSAQTLLDEDASTPLATLAGHTALEVIGAFLNPIPEDLKELCLNTWWLLYCHALQHTLKSETETYRIFTSGMLSGIARDLRDLVRGINKLPTRYDGAVLNFLEEYIGTPEHLAPFGGRDAELDRLDAWLNNTQSKRYLLLAARAGAGKSALLAHWAARLDRRGERVVFFPISARFQTNSASVAWSSLAARISELHGQPVTASSDASHYRGVFQDLLRSPLASGKRLVVILDGLDEAAGWAVHDLFPAIPPAQLHVVAAARPLANDQGPEQWRDRMGWRTTAQVVTLQPLDRAGLADVLHRMGDPLAPLSNKFDVITELLRLTEGDPLLIRLYVEQLREQVESPTPFHPETLQKLKPGLESVFRNWFEWQAQITGTNPAGAKEVLEIFRFCSQALGPLPAADILQLAPRVFTHSAQVQNTAQSVARFLIGTPQDGYVFSHPRLAHFWEEEKLSSQEQEETRSRFADQSKIALQRASSSGDVSPYYVRWAVAHLNKAASLGGLHNLVISASWCRAWEALEGTPSGFLRDAHCCADRGGISQKLRFALFRSSVETAQNSIPRDVYASCVGAGAISMPLARVIARSRPDPYDRAVMLAVCGSHLKGQDRTNVLRQALNAVQADNLHRRKEALLEVTLRLVESDLELFPMALGAARDIEQSLWRAEALIAVVGRMRESERRSMFHEVLESVRRMNLVGRRAKALSKLAAWLGENDHELLRDVLDMVPEIRLPSHQTEALLAVADRMGYISRQQVLQEARDAARRIEDGVVRATALSAVACRIGELEQPILLLEALDAARSIEDRRRRAIALASVGERLAKGDRDFVLGEAVAALREIEDDWGRADALAAVTENLRVGDQELIDEALELARGIADRNVRVHAMAELAGRMGGGSRQQLLSEALCSAREIVRDLGREEPLMNVIRGLSESDAALLSEALDAISEIGDGRSRATALVALAGQMGVNDRRSVLQEALASARSIGDGRSLVFALVAVAARLEERDRNDVFNAALRAARGIHDVSHRSAALAAVAELLEGCERKLLLREALNQLQTITNDHSRARALETVAGHLRGVGQGLLQTAIEVTRNIRDSNSRASALAALTERISEGGSKLAQQALVVARGIPKDAARAKALAAVAGRLSANDREQVLVEAMAAALQTVDDWQRAMALKAVVERLSAGDQRFMREALEALPRIRDEWGLAETLAALARCLPADSELMGLTLVQARRLRQDGYRASALAAVGERLRDGDRQVVVREALEAAQCCDSDSTLAYALAAVVSVLGDSDQELLHETLRAVRTIGDAKLRVVALAAVARRLPAEGLPSIVDDLITISHKAPIDRLLHQFVKKQPELLKPHLSKLVDLISCKARSQLLAEIRTLLPVLAIGGDHHAIDELLKAIHDTASEWP